MTNNFRLGVMRVHLSQSPISGYIGANTCILTIFYCVLNKHNLCQYISINNKSHNYGLTELM